MRVLDSSAFIAGYETDDDIATIPLVREELTDASMYRFDAMEGGGMRVHVPDEAAVNAARQAARRTGDLDTLSDTDLRLVAAAHELDATLVTDDYAMQNVASDLGVPVDVVQQEGITETREWVFQCQGCGRTFDEDRERCPVCGSSLTRKNPS
ncbi:NOB1 family endonuclease [Salarchaeum japonicum]|uniref:NOB1 family endonuclease n=1 Tax=Salarchaeum japonicum TaxID=555573 RepID=UPI003C7472D0